MSLPKKITINIPERTAQAIKKIEGRLEWMFPKALNICNEITAIMTIPSYSPNITIGNNQLLANKLSIRQNHEKCNRITFEIGISCSSDSQASATIHICLFTKGRKQAYHYLVISFDEITRVAAFEKNFD